MQTESATAIAYAIFHPSLKSPDGLGVLEASQSYRGVIADTPTVLQSCKKLTIK
jgi:hypothetical protein